MSSVNDRLPIEIDVDRPKAARIYGSGSRSRMVR
jgi:hypothetical protein